jgi:predicted aspartyl protease
MGTFEVHIGIGHPAGGDFNALSATVDTGATHSMMPGTLLERLRIRPIQTGRYGIADGSVVEYGVADARFSIDGVERYCPVIFGPEDEYLVGATTLEIFELVVDPLGERLVPAKQLRL